MATFSQTDIEARIRLSKDGYNTLLDKYINSIKMGRKCALEELNTLLVISTYIEILEDYYPLVCFDPSNSNFEYNNNCVSEEEIQLIADKLSKLINIEFKPAGYNYSGLPYIPQGIGVMQIGCNFVVS